MTAPFDDEAVAPPWSDQGILRDGRRLQRMGAIPTCVDFTPRDYPKPIFAPALPAIGAEEKRMSHVNMVDGNGFGWALQALRNGAAVTRRGWNGKGMYIRMQVPDEHSKMRHPYLFIVPVGGGPVPWVASQADLLAEDWIEFDSPPAP